MNSVTLFLLDFEDWASLLDFEEDAGDTVGVKVRGVMVGEVADAAGQN